MAFFSWLMNYLHRKLKAKDRRLALAIACARARPCAFTTVSLHTPASHRRRDCFLGPSPRPLTLGCTHHCTSQQRSPRLVVFGRPSDVGARSSSSSVVPGRSDGSSHRRRSEPLGGKPLRRPCAGGAPMWPMFGQYAPPPQVSSAARPCTTVGQSFLPGYLSVVGGRACAQAFHLSHVELSLWSSVSMRTKLSCLALMQSLRSHNR